MRKGISPLVAAVILIAATMSIAGILSFWANSFIEQKLRESENSTQETGCIGAKFSLYSGTYDNDTTSADYQTLYLIIENERLFDLTLDKLYIFKPNNVLEEKDIDVTLRSNEIKSFNVTGISNIFSVLRIKTNCPDVQIDIAPSALTITTAD